MFLANLAAKKSYFSNANFQMSHSTEILLSDSNTINLPDRTAKYFKSPDQALGAFKTGAI